MTSLPIAELHQLATNALAGQGFPVDQAAQVSEEFVVAEYAGVRTHGIGKIPSMNFGRLDIQPQIKQLGSVIAVNGNGGNGFTGMRVAAEMLIDVARDVGIGLAAATNFSRFSSLYPYTEIIAGAGLVGVLLNSAGPPAVAPHGSFDPVTGTNPICFSFPTSTGPHTIDFSTSELVWGEVRLAAQEKRGLHQNTFFDTNGGYTTNPHQVHSVKSFGGAKGFSLNLALEVPGGLLTGGLAGSKVETEFQCGALMIAVAPTATGAASSFSEDIAQLLTEVRAASPLPGGPAVRAPGDRARSRIRIDAIGAEPVEIPDSVVAQLKHMASGGSTTDVSTNPLFN